MNLPLQLPVSNDRHMNLLWCALGKPAIRFRVIVSKFDTIAVIKEEASRLFGVPVRLMMMREILFCR